MQPIRRTTLHAPTILWHSDPVGPDETVVLQGDGFSADAVVELAAVSANSGPDGWVVVEPVQRSSQCLKAVIPAGWEPGLFACRVRQGERVSNPVTLNEPDLWWSQGDAGRGRATPGGWLRVFGKCLHVADASRVVLVSPDGAETPLPPSSSTTYHLSAAIPADLPNGIYAVRIHNGAGGASGWREAGNVSIQAVATPAPAVLDVVDFGADPGGRNDCTLAIVQALEHLAGLGGGVLHFPRGRYRIDSILRSGMWISHPLKIPRGVTLRGVGADLVSLWWPDQKEPLPTLIEGGSDFGVEDLSIYTQGRHRNIISAESDVRIRRVRIRANCYYMTGHNGRPHHGRGCENEIFHVGTAIELSGTNVQVTECDIYCSGPAFALKHVRDGLIANNRIRAMDMVFLSGGRRVIFENNDFEGNQLTCGGNNIALHFGAVSCRHVYYAGNRVSHIYGGDHEALTFDGHGTAYFGRVAGLEETRLLLASEPLLGFDGTVDSLRTLHDTTIYIVSGRGAGQYRSITSFAGRELEIDRPWLVPPDSSSLAVVGAYNGRHLIIGNTAEDAGALVQLYSPNCECIVAENRALHASGLSSMSKLGINDHERYSRIEPSWFNQFLDNHVVWGNGWGGGETEVDRWLGGEGYLNIWGWQISFYKDNDGQGDDQDRLLRPEALAALLGEDPQTVRTLPLSRAQIVRRHKVDNHSSIRIRGAVADVLVERCELADSDLGIRVDNEPERQHTEIFDMLYCEPTQEPPIPGQGPPFLSPSGVLLRKNKMQRVKTPYSGTALESVRIE